MISMMRGRPIPNQRGRRRPAAHDGPVQLTPSGVVPPVSSGHGPQRPGAIPVGALAIRAAAVGAAAVGALAIGRLAIGRAVVRRLKIEELEVQRMRVHELQVDQQRTAAQA